MVTIRCKNNNSLHTVQAGSSLLDLYHDFDLNLRFQPITARINNRSEGLKYRLYNNSDVEFLDITSTSGMRVYVRSLCFVLYKAVQDVFPGSKLFIEHSISGGYYCNFIKPALDGRTRGLSELEIEQIRQRMEEIVRLDMPFHRHVMPTEEALSIFKERGLNDKVKLLETMHDVYTTCYSLDDTFDYYYGPLAPSAGYLKVFGLVAYGDGMLLRVPDASNPEQLKEMTPQPMTFDVYKEQVRWNVIMHLSNAGDVNKVIENGMATETILVSEALQEKKIAKISEDIYRRNQEDGVKLILITGPSSSGKTTFCKRLSIQLLACGLRPLSFSTDDYFVNRVDTPLLPNGQYDFDNFETVDHALLGDHLDRLLNGDEVEVPEYNFTTGKREWNGKRLQLTPKHVLIIEGIHALNPRLTSQVGDNKKYKIYISALTSVSLDAHNWIPMRDNRLLRRIIRDYNKGAFTARETIQNWPNVCDAEEKWIFPYQENADVMFNSALTIEFAVLRNHAVPILQSVPKDCPEYCEAHRLLKFIHHFTPISDKEIPATSIMREFVGGSSFK